MTVLAGPERLEHLEEEECWRLLARQGVGRVAFTERALPAILPVSYALLGTSVVMRLRRDGLARRLDGQVVAFEIDDFDLHHRTGWSVMVVGTARILHGAEALTAPPSWAGPSHQTVVAITPGDVQGRRIVAAEDDHEVPIAH
jgi:hypothetical protein